jgi:outer membrane protein assembly factor BamA
VIFTTDVTSTAGNLKRFHEVYNGITYKYVKDIYSKKILDRRVFQYPGQRFSRTDMLETQRQLLNLDNFKFVNINYDTIGNRFIANIFTSPLKKYQMSNEAGVNVTEGLPGPFYNLTLITRNVFRGLENLEISGTIGYEGVASATDRSKVYTSLEMGAFLSLIFPQFLLPLKLSLKSRFGQFNPKTTFSAGFAFTNRNEYKRAGFNTYLNYSWQKNLEKFFNVRIADVSLIRSTIKDPAFQDALDDIKARGNNFWRTFKPSLVLSTSFSKTRNFNQYTSYLSRKAAFLKYTIEAGGSILNFMDVDYLDTTGLELYKYVKLTGDYRKYLAISPKTKIAYRIRAGIATPYAKNDVLPYEKYLFIGGSNSNRAWRPRRLGPGSYANVDTVYADTGTILNYNDNFEQPGELLLEANFELRTQVIGFFHTALFVDAGNIWTLNRDPQRPGAHFEFNRFYKEIALGAGIGARFDFTFLLLRLDMGFRMYDPSLPSGYRWFTQYNTDKITGIDKIIFNLAIGYPF